IILCGISATPPHKEINKTAIGATASVSWKYFSNVFSLTEYLHSQGYKLVGVEQTNNSLSLENWHPNFKNGLALIFGNEVEGLSEELLPHLDFALEIPQFGTKHSFNVSVSAGIVGWHAILKGHCDV
ncbi:MAG: TrmH family RNA methyltransferase, partial [Bacteroidetes bacterium]|nr:TrmH family RNA methyltransferase [Bacteroidota bacterium]